MAFVVAKLLKLLQGIWGTFCWAGFIYCFIDFTRIYLKYETVSTVSLREPKVSDAPDISV